MHLKLTFSLYRVHGVHVSIYDFLAQSKAEVKNVELISKEWLN